MFARLVLDSACSFFLPPFSFQIRVGALYLLYSLHSCQTAEPREQVAHRASSRGSCPGTSPVLLLQVRVALKDWEDIQALEKDAAEARHLDAVYILRKLVMQKAFYFTAMPTPVLVLFQRLHHS